MISLPIFFLLLYRLRYFTKLSRRAVPRLSGQEVGKMHLYSRIAVGVYALFAMASFIPWAMNKDGVAPRTDWTMIIAVSGLFVAAVFDQRAEAIRRRGASSSEALRLDRVRWFHVAVAVLAPFVGLPWGLVNIARRRPRSGQIMLLISFAELALLCAFYNMSR